MLVSISGSQGCGKTTTLNELKGRGYNVLERKTSRSILTDWNVSLYEVNNNHELTIKFQDEILNRKRDDESTARASDEVWFTERSYADLFTYALIDLGRDNQYNDWVEQYYAKCVELQKTYKAVYYLKAGHFVPEHDGVRGSNPFYSRMVDLVMYDYTHTMTPTMSLITIDTPNLDQRVDILQQYANKWR